jgi:hypothetical protein
MPLESGEGTAPDFFPDILPRRPSFKKVERPPGSGPLVRKKKAKSGSAFKVSGKGSTVRLLKRRRRGPDGTVFVRTRSISVDPAPTRALGVDIFDTYLEKISGIIFVFYVLGVSGSI